MKRRVPIRRRLADYWSVHPLVDLWAIPLVFAVCLAWSPDVRADLVPFLSGVATLGGVAMAAESFICTMVFTYSSEPLVVARDNLWFKASRVSWIMILSGTCVMVAVSLLALLLPPSQPTLMLSVGLTSLVAMMLFFARSVLWLRLTLMATRAS